MSSSKTVVEYTAKRITYHTSLPFAEIAARLEKEINKPSGGPAVFRALGGSKSKDELESNINVLTNGRDFVYFLEFAHHRWLDTYTGSTGTPQTIVYTFGNPLIAQTMLRHNLAAGLHIPPKLMLLEDGAGNGTKVIYDDPASVIAVVSEPGVAVSEELKHAAERLSAKVEELVKTIIAE
ncbi:TT1751-like protein [Trametes coccinea BRFM310]|uniref:TT1751-like protein n=1 Tax=Trametes coccinea (strain BRFM310) TaxID=1353009 RepID=A0A1Y2IIR1_TRAC3|nr:TT1751-like protein [Trametes coccinea BRFM310]